MFLQSITIILLVIKLIIILLIKNIIIFLFTITTRFKIKFFFFEPVKS